jgi:hypothetical protein
MTNELSSITGKLNRLILVLSGVLTLMITFVLPYIVSHAGILQFTRSTVQLISILMVASFASHLIQAKGN